MKILLSFIALLAVGSSALMTTTYANDIKKITLINWMFVTECDELASHPDDPERRGAGVSDEDLEVTKAVSSCVRVLEGDHDDIQALFQLGRSLLLLGEVEEASVFLSQAANTGHAAASAHLADLYLLNENLSDEYLLDVLALYEWAFNTGYLPAQFQYSELKLIITGELVPGHPEVSQTPSQVFETDSFENGLVLTALLEGDFEYINSNFTDEVLREYGADFHFHVYMNSFIETLNYGWVCPNYISAGVASKIKKNTRLRVASMVFNPKALFAITERVVDRVGNSTTVGSRNSGLRNGVDALVGSFSDGLSVYETLIEMGVKDAYALQESHYDCNSTEAARLAENLVRYVDGQLPIPVEG